MPITRRRILYLPEKEVEKIGVGLFIPPFDNICIFTHIWRRSLLHANSGEVSWNELDELE